jgi:hypothetical protein
MGEVGARLVKDLLEEASGIAELRDMDRLKAFLDELTTWRPQHDGECLHCHEEIGELTTRLLDKHQMPQPWTYHKLLEIMGMED